MKRMGGMGGMGGSMGMPGGKYTDYGLKLK